MKKEYEEMVDLTHNPFSWKKPFTRMRYALALKKYAKQRAKVGYSHFDLVDFDVYIAAVMSDALNAIKDLAFEEGTKGIKKEFGVTEVSAKKIWCDMLKRASDDFAIYATETGDKEGRHEAFERGCDMLKRYHKYLNSKEET